MVRMVMVKKVSWYSWQVSAALSGSHVSFENISNVLIEMAIGDPAYHSPFDRTTLGDQSNTKVDRKPHNGSCQ